MILISDSGATKADFVAIDKEGNKIFTTETLGLNPEVITEDIIKARLHANKKLVKYQEQITDVYFYGAGCGTERMRIFLRDIFKGFFNKACIMIKEDTYAAVYATINPKESAIVCILGTGSNCSYWDGLKLHQKVESLGYTIMDDCSGNYFGKKLIRGFYFGNMPKDLADKFAKEFDMKSDTIKENIYKKPNPNKYLASFAKFMVSNKHHNFCEKMINEGFELFIKNYILQYPESKNIPIHFVGSIAFYLKDELNTSLKQFGLQIGNIKRRPIEGLIEYYKNDIL